MRVGGHNTEPDFSRLGPAMLVAAAVIVAVRTARWPARRADTTCQQDLRVEIEHGIHVANTILSALLAGKANLFPSRQVPWYVADDEDVPK